MISFSVFGQKTDSVRFFSKNLNQERDILVYTPDEYDDEPLQKFGVIYVFDAQFRAYFDLVTAAIDFYNQGYPMIVVGIISSYCEDKKQSRSTDFLPPPQSPETSEKWDGFLGNADHFIQYLSDEVVPYLEQHYRTLPTKIAIGHSLGATFISYCLLKNPDLFDAYIAVSPNYEYDDELLVKAVQKFNPDAMCSKKFFYLCHAGENWKGWENARKNVIAVFETEKFKNKFEFKNQDFSATESHGTVFPIGVINGLKDYFSYQFFTADNLIAYYQTLSEKRQIILTPDNTNQFAYNLYYATQNAGDALKVLLWANQQFPDDLNLYDSIEEMYQKLNDTNNTLKYSPD